MGTEAIHERDPDIETAIARYAASFSIDAVPTAVVDRARLVLLDTVGVGINGSATDYVRDTVETAHAHGIWGTTGEKTSTVFATRDRRGPLAATVANASGTTTLELDEGSQDSGHMGIHVVPPAVALAEAHGKSGVDLLEAIVLAYEVSARLGAVNRPLTDGLHPHGEWATVAGAVATGSLLGFDVEKYRQAIRIAANPFVGVHWAAATEGATVRNFYSGISCAHGVMAALLADSGVTGVRGSISRCLLPFTAADPIDGDTLTETFGNLGEYYFLEDNYFKIHAACRYAHAPVEALEGIDGFDAIDPDAIDRIVVRTIEAGTILDTTDPHNVLSAKFSIPYVLAARIIVGSSDYDAFTDELLRNPEIGSLADRVDVVSDERYNTALEESSRWGATVEVHLADGTVESNSVADPRGGKDDPFEPEEIIEKFDRLVASETDEPTARKIRESLLDVEHLDSVTDLFTPLLE